jgi:SpoVK/Ycf46/Vps4 family AAA+-type ATPase
MDTENTPQKKTTLPTPQNLGEGLERAGLIMALRLARSHEGQSAFQALSVEHSQLLFVGIPESLKRRRTKPKLIELALELLEPHYAFCWDAFKQRMQPLIGRLRLDDVALQVLFTGACIQTCRVFRLMALEINGPRKLLGEVLAAMHSGRKEQFLSVFDLTHPLIESGLLAPSEGYHNDLEDHLRLMRGATDALLDAAPIDQALMRLSLDEANTSKLTLSDFAYMQADVALVLDILKLGLAQNTSTHILLCGTPGTGKTELALALAQACGAPALCVRTEIDEGEPAGRTQRIQGYALAQRLQTRPCSVVTVFDEAEDVFYGGQRFEYGEGDRRYKGWTNRLLEQACSPTIWITNDASVIDPAYLRRFDYVLRVNTPPRSVRRDMLKRALRDLPVPAGWLERLAEPENLTPADIARIEKLRPLLQADPSQLEERVARLLSCRPGGVSQKEVMPRNEELKLPYRLDWINADADLKHLSQGLQRRGRGSLCFFGPPGTGKTEFARELARLLDKPLLLRKASDWLDMYLGQTEAKMAASFERALMEDAVLFIDEADTFLQDRRRAQRSWEISQVNELLAQLDGFKGVVILASNFAEGFDPAVIRRLDAKVRFSYLTGDTLWQAFQASLGLLNLPTAPEYRLAVEGLKEIALGDFAVVLRRMSMEEQVNAERLLELLRSELRSKGQGDKNPIGFA